MHEMREAQARLEAALSAGDLEAARAAGRVLVARCLEIGGAVDTLAHADRLADLGLQAAATVHELRQPLAGIKAFAQLVAASASNPGSVIEKAGAIERYAEMMETLCDRLRGYARATPMARTPGNVNAAVQAGVEMLKLLLRAPPVTLDIALADALPAVALDAVGLQQIVVNLVRNAREAMPDRQGRIRIVTRATADGVEVEVSDDGPGIAPEVLERLFTPFASSKPAGSGLGLWLSRRLALEVGGALDHVGGREGATFRLRLPAAPER